MNFSNFWDVALISTIKLSICDYGKGKKNQYSDLALSTWCWLLIELQNDFFLSAIWLYWVVHLESSQYNLTSKKKKDLQIGHFIQQLWQGIYKCCKIQSLFSVNTV